MLNYQHVLLVHPLGYQTDAAGADIARFANIMPPIGLAGLAAWLDKLGFETTLVDCYARPNSIQDIKDLLNRPAVRRVFEREGLQQPWV